MFNISDNIDKVQLSHKCPECGDIFTEAFIDSSEYASRASNADEVQEYLENYLGFESLEDLEEGIGATIRLPTVCEKTQCQLKIKHHKQHTLTAHLQVPRGLKNVPAAASSAIIDTSHNILITGPVGSGKTWKAVGLLKKWLLDSGGETKRSYKFMNVCELLFTMHEEFNKKTQDSSVLRKCLAVDILVLDDLGTEKFSEWSTAQLYLIINHRMDDLKPTIVTTNYQVKELKKRFNDRIASRLLSYVSVELTGADRRQES